MTDPAKGTGEDDGGTARGDALGIDGETHDLLCRLQEEGARQYPGAGCVGTHWKSWTTHAPTAAVGAWVRADGKQTADTPCPAPLPVRATILMTPTRGHGDWGPDRVLLVDGDTTVRTLPAQHQVVTDAWRILSMPRLVHMPERNRLLLFVRREMPYRHYLPDSVTLLSDDGGASWSAPAVTPRGLCHTAYLGRGRLLLGGGRHGPCGFELLEWRSDDYGATWSGDTVPGRADGRPFWQWGDCLVDRDDDGQATRLVAPGYTEREGWPGACSMLRFSYDDGRTWPEEIAPPAWNGECGVGVSEVTLARAANGTMVAACRISYPQNEGKVDFYSGLGVSLSDDDGRTWSDIEVLYEYGRHHAGMALTPGGGVVMTYVVRLGTLDEARRVLDDDGVPQWCVEAVVSRDNGKTWDTTRRYVLARWSGMSGVQDTATVRLPDGSLLTAFGGGYRSEQDREIKGPPIEIGLVRWKPDAGVNPGAVERT